MSSFDDKPTLLEWLKKVQKALNESVLKTVSVSQEKTGKVNSITLSFNFEDGTKITAPAFTVNDGADGAKGKDADFELLTAIQSVVGDFESITYDTTDGLTLVSQGELTYNGKKTATTFTTRIPVIGSANISIDLDEVNQKLVFSIDKLNDFLLTPLGKVMGVGTTEKYLGFTLNPEPRLVQRANVGGTPITTTYIMPTVGNVTANLLSDKNVKTLFGNKSIAGSGNIDLYRHDIQITDSQSAPTMNVHIYYISSNNLKVDSLTDLKTLLGLDTYFQYFDVQGRKYDGTYYDLVGYIDQTGVHFLSGTTDIVVNWSSCFFTDNITTI